MYQLQKKLLFVIVLFVAISCNNSSGDKEAKTDNPEKNVSTNNGQDAQLTDWLKGKVLTADESKDYHNFKLYTDGTCEDKGGAKVNWTIEDGKLNMGGIMKIAIEKKDDTTLILHRSLSDESYRVSPL